MQYICTTFTLQGPSNPRHPPRQHHLGQLSVSYLSCSQLHPPHLHPLRDLSPDMNSLSSCHRRYFWISPLGWHPPPPPPPHPLQHLLLHLPQQSLDFVYRY